MRYLLLLLAPILAAQQPDKQAVRIGCQTTTFEMQPGQVDHAVVLKDPAGEQTVLFDTTSGGAIVSFKYKGREHIWGWNGGGLLQMAFHNSRKDGPWAGDYNPTQAGDGSAFSPVTGIACQGTEAVTILTMMLDFNHNNGFYQKALVAVWGGRVNDMVPLSFFAPYTLETRASWVRNPAGTPQYYLKLEERFTHIADEKIGDFGYDFACYMPWEYDVRAIRSEAKYVAGGWYRDPARTEGLATAMAATNFPDAKIGGGFNSDYMWRNRNFHLTSRGALDGIASKQLVWYVMAGAWEDALRFAQGF